MASTLTALDTLLQAAILAPSGDNTQPWRFRVDREGQSILAGQVIGTVGGERTPQGAHIEFQVRAPVRGTIPEPVDPLAWLTRRSGM